MTVKRFVDLTPMVDVIFLLVIFFMTSSSLIDVNSVKIDLPEAKATDKELTQPTMLSINKQGEYYIDGKKIKTDEVEAKLQQLIQQKEIKFLLIEGYKNLPYQRIIEVMSIAKRSGMERISLSVQSPQ